MVDNSSTSKSDSDNVRASSKKASRKRQRNPLSHARGKQHSHDSIWFRRIGAGYHLFAKYYTGQPLGTLCERQSVESGESSVSTNNNLVGSGNEQNKGTGAGLSRAAKRRKKKKQQRNNTNTDNDEERVDQQKATDDRGKVSESAPSTKKEGNINEEHQNYPLLQALSKQSAAFQTNKAADLLRPCFVALSKPLPVTFRLRRSLERAQVKELETKIQREFQFLVKPLPFGGTKDGCYTYQAKCSKPDLTKKYNALKTFLVEHSQNGSLARQEVGSMLPLLVLEHAGAIGASTACDTDNNRKRSKCRILDLCASPGSKTLQALELMVDPNTSKKVPSVNSTSRCILANDVSESRLQALQDAIQRSGMQEQHLNRIGYTCEDARQLSTTKPPNVVICDVPCSGDGTVRKDPHILELWKPSQGNALHALQLQILQRALTLVQVGGVVCYSTCSLNPVENEAVVAAALRHFNDSNIANENKNDESTNKKNDGSSSGAQQPIVELLEFPPIPGLQRRQGLCHWRIADLKDVDAQQSQSDDNDDEIPHLAWYDTYQDARNHKMENAVPTMWPRRGDNADNDNLHMDRCIRLWPQDHDTGGFFLALIRRYH